MAFTIFPAIDLRNGRCVRLRQGRAEDETVYAEDPAAVARRWHELGGRYLHVVDLDGAFEGRPVQVEAVRRIAAAVPIPVEVGGGLRTDDDVDRLLGAGAARVVVGTRALGSERELERLAARYGERLVVGIDARHGRVQIRGWTETTERLATDLAAAAAAAGVHTVVFTETSRDGMLSGVPLEAVDAVCAAASCRVVASGGVCTAADVSALRGLGRPNLAGVIVGKALYEGTARLPELLAAAARAAGA